MSDQRPNGAEPGPAPTAEPVAGVLAALPRTRPQRASARRAQARARTQHAQSETTPAKVAKETATKVAKETARKKKKTTTTTTGERRKTSRPRPPREERAPRQGYEPEDEVELGHTVHPPSGVELIESLADIVGELAGAGASAGGRLLKDALSILRRP